MIRIDDKWSISSDRYNFIVVGTCAGKSKDGEVKKHTHKTFHPNLEQCLRYIRQQDCKNAGTLLELLEALKKAYKLDFESAMSAANKLTRVSIAQTGRAVAQ